MQGASEQCMQATEIDRSPGLPSWIVTTLRRFIPQGTSCSFLHAVTQALHSMQRSASTRNLARAISHIPPLSRVDLAERGLGLLHLRDGVVAICLRGVGAFTQNIGVRPFRVFRPAVFALE